MFGLAKPLPHAGRTRRMRTTRPRPCRLTRPVLEPLEDRSLPAPLGMASALNMSAIPTAAVQSLASASLQVSLFAAFSSGQLSASGFPLALQIAGTSRNTPPPSSLLGPASPARTFVPFAATPGAGVSLPPPNPYVRQDTSLSGGGNEPQRNPDDLFSDEPQTDQQTSVIQPPAHREMPDVTLRALLSLCA